MPRFLHPHMPVQECYCIPDHRIYRRNAISLPRSALQRLVLYRSVRIFQKKYLLFHFHKSYPYSHRYPATSHNCGLQPFRFLWLLVPASGLCMPFHYRPDMLCSMVPCWFSHFPIFPDSSLYLPSFCLLCQFSSNLLIIHRYV